MSIKSQLINELFQMIPYIHLQVVLNFTDGHNKRSYM